MFPVMVFALNFRNATALIKDVCKGNVFYAKNIHKCKPRPLYTLRHHAPIRGSEVSSYREVIRFLKSPDVKNVIVLAGAGISTPCGIPDFRTPGTGLYDNLQKYSLPFPEAIFDLNYFSLNQRPFFQLAKELYPGKYSPGVAHYFVKLLDEKKKLLRMYTQNIDGLEKLAGIPPSKLVEAHGSFEMATCLRCGVKYHGEAIKEDIFADRIPICKQENCNGIIKPDIIFFGEILPERFNLYVEDMKNVDLMIVMGTSLVVYPFKLLADMASNCVPRLLINRENVFADYRKNDVLKEGEIQVVIKDFIKRLGWSEDLEKVMHPDGAK